ncbi:hypothetical protein ID866_9016 [Astraeus odoratus]|nr:hypothetical protein ID866_9016 [Astraeus odoratus]
MNDMMLVMGSLNVLENVKHFLKGELEISDLGDVHLLLDFEIKHDQHDHTLTLSQKYLKGTSCWEIVFGPRVKDLVGYTDVDGSMNEDCHTILEYVLLIDGGPISWSVKM